ncbi:MAG: hypothetical protein LBC94_03605 [Desulfovibrio sp.]|jgi:hypothetical protein|nr:hypothetical protein [Desulfovibrio sp.]
MTSKQIYADLNLENVMLKDVIKKIVRPVQKKELVSYWIARHGLSLRKYCKAFGVSLSYFKTLK